MKKIIMIGCLLMMGCRGKQGETGVQGLRGPGDIEVLSGPVASNDFNVFDSRINQAKQLTVYINGGGQSSELPYFLPASGVNTFFIVSSGKIEIVNASLAGATGYTIVLIL